MDRATIVDQLRAAFTGRPGIVAAYLFGSVARDEVRPSSEVAIGVILAQDGWISVEDAEVWRQIIAVRNIAVHPYLQVDAKIMRNIAERRTEDLMRFVHRVRERLQELNPANS